MAYDDKTKRLIYNKTSGKCHICHKRLCFGNYNRRAGRQCWHVDHSIPRSKGGTDHINNLFAACIGCNSDKSNSATRTARRKNGKQCAPLSPEKRKEAQSRSGFAGAVAGGIAGFVVAGPIGAAIGAVAGGAVGSSQNPDR